MSTQPVNANSACGTLSVLSVSPLAEDHRCLRAIIGDSMAKLYEAEGVRPALAILQQHEVHVILCERDLTTGIWIELLESLIQLPRTPQLIVTSRLADERLWAEALHLGAWDVLSKPFDRSEVLRTVKLAWLHWNHQIQMSASSVKVMEAAS